MKDITVIIPVHNLSNEYVAMLQKAIDNINQMRYDENLIKVCVVIPANEEEPPIKGWNPERFNIIRNAGATDYCTQINTAVPCIDTEYFTIMEVDDRYNTKWFNMFTEYLDQDDDISIYLPINVVTNAKTNGKEFVNHIAWSTGFTANEENADVADTYNVGYITFNSLQDISLFNLTGGIFKTRDWLSYKPSIQVAFNYEYLLRATNKKQKVFVVPKEGYYHTTFRDDSLTEKYLNDINDKDVVKWFELAKREYAFDEDRNNGIIADDNTVLN